MNILRKVCFPDSRFQNENEKITEIESIIAREKEFAMEMSEGGGANSVLQTKDQDWEDILPVGERSSRLAMKAAADDYFDMFAEEPIYGTPFAKPCHRWENGFQTTKGGSFGGKEYVAGDCSPKGLVIKHNPRRIPLVDVEAGIVVAYIHFGNLPDFHMFKMRNGRVELIQAVIGPASPSMGWPIEPICKDRRLIPYQIRVDFSLQWLKQRSEQTLCARTLSVYPPF